MSQYSPEDIAQKIANLLRDASPSPNSLETSIAELNARLERIERSIAETKIQVPTIKPEHPSQDKFSVAEAIADEIFEGFQKEKACTFEPNGKPCDHCSMCSSRGF
ncbi:MAG: hypothetical protein ACR2IH_10325 [Pyrinomonadaceae bacterium]